VISQNSSLYWTSLWEIAAIKDAKNNSGAGFLDMKYKGPRNVKGCHQAEIDVQKQLLRRYENACYDGLTG